MRKTRRLDATLAITLADFSIVETLCFLAGWSPPSIDPPRAAVGRWPDWAAYLRDFLAVREELVERFAERRGGRPMFGDLVEAYARAHGIAALAHASDYALRGEPEPHDGETDTAYAARMARSRRKG